MAYSSIAIANYFINAALRADSPVDHLKLQKLVYIAHGWNLAINGAPLLRAPVEAWPYGPVVPGLYHRLKHKGAQVIREPLQQFGDEDTPTPTVDDPATRRILDRVWELYGRYSGVHLSNLTHEPGTPWYLTRERSQGARDAPIDNALIRDHYVKLAQRRDGGL